MTVAIYLDVNLKRRERKVKKVLYLSKDVGSDKGAQEMLQRARMKLCCCRLIV